MILISSGNAQLSPRSSDTTSRGPVQLKSPVKANAHKTIDIIPQTRSHAHQPKQLLGGGVAGGLDVTGKSIIKKT